MFPYKTSILLDRSSRQSLYLQLSKQIIELIKENRLPSKTKLPGSRTLSGLLGVHRKTIVACYDELTLQGWIESIPKKGTFVHNNLPELEQQKLSNKTKDEFKLTAGFNFYKNEVLKNTVTNNLENFTSINDGVSDGRLTPINEIARIYRRITSRKEAYTHLSYGSTFGNDKLRNVLAEYLNKTRGLHISSDNILITRGSQNGIYLTTQLLLKESDTVIVGTTNYIAA
ncbi:MAG: aminotransferase class I/II-fold pyridoxal phosphate-dependent enzyme, partial [Flavobacteriaceae bacterium]|nr:aminotransferase class I/II-fold pyridoxal phosphate-dependent enzyme [Flavobacteriaceae bacterium]